MSDGGSKLGRWVAELRRRKVIRVAAAYLVVAWLLVQVAGTTFEPLGLPPWALKLVIVVFALGFPVACVLAWAFDVTPHGVERTPSDGPRTLPAEAFAAPAAPRDAPAEAPAAASASLPAAHQGTPASPAKLDSVAILPFVDMSPEHDQEYFCDGIAEEIINSLCCIRGLRIASRTSSFQYKGRALDVRAIGRELGVASVLEGSVRKAGARVRITAQLIDASNGYHLWSESYDRELCDVFDIQAEIAQKMAVALRGTLSREERALIGRGGTANGEAYDLYLRAQSHLRDGSDLGVAAALPLFRDAIRRDPNFAQAHAGIAHALAIKGLWRIAMTGPEFDEAYAAGQRALELEPLMPEAVLARAMLESLEGRVADADRSFEQAIALNPADFDANYIYGRHCFQHGRFEAAVAHFETAVRLRPDDYQALCLLESALLKTGRAVEHAAVAKRAMAAIEARLALDPREARALQLGTVQAARIGNAQRSREIAEQVIRYWPEGFSTWYNVACAYAVIGDVDAAFDALAKALRRGSGNRGWIANDPDFDNLRADPRFQQLLDATPAS